MLSGKNPFHQQQAYFNQAPRQQQSKSYWLSLGENLADEVFKQAEKNPAERDFIAKCARDSVNQLCGNDLDIKMALATGFKNRMAQYGVQCNAS